MTRDEATAAIVMKTPLSPQDVNDLLDVAGDPGGIETLMRLYARQGRGPDLTGWQTAAAILSEIQEIAVKVAPLVAVIVQVAPLL